MLKSSILKMVELSLEADTLPHIIETVSYANLVLGFHGAILILAMFLSTSSVSLEM